MPFEIHTVAFPDTFKQNEIIDFLHKHQLKPMKQMDHKVNYYRVRIKHPKLFKSFITKVLPNNIHLILGLR